MLVPTRELCVQVTEEFELVAGSSIKVASVYGGVPLKAQAREARDASTEQRPPTRDCAPTAGCLATAC